MDLLKLTASPLAAAHLSYQRLQTHTLPANLPLKILCFINTWDSFGKVKKSLSSPHPAPLLPALHDSMTAQKFRITSQDAISQTSLKIRVTYVGLQAEILYPPISGKVILTKPISDFTAFCSRIRSEHSERILLYFTNNQTLTSANLNIRNQSLFVYAGRFL